MKKVIKRKIVESLDYPLFDHPIWKKDKLILRCYPCWKESFRDLLKVCDENDLDFSVKSGSDWSPDCFTVTIFSNKPTGG